MALGEGANDLVSEFGSAPKAAQARVTDVRPLQSAKAVEDRPSDNQSGQTPPSMPPLDPLQGGHFANIFGFEGRTNRLGYLLINVVAVPITVVCAGVTRDGVAAPAVSLLTLLIIIPGIWIILAAGWRRCHDAGWSGYWALLALLPLVSLVFGVVMLFVPSAAAQHRSRPSQPAS